MTMNAEIGMRPKILAYGLFGKMPYHFSRMYFSPCAIKIASGIIRNRIDSGSKPEMKNEKIIRPVAMEFLDAKNPFMVEKIPTKTRKKVGMPMIGVKTVPSGLLLKLKSKCIADLMF